MILHVISVPEANKNLLHEEPRDISQVHHVQRHVTLEPHCNSVGLIRLPAYVACYWCITSTPQSSSSAASTHADRFGSRRIHACGKSPPPDRFWPAPPPPKPQSLDSLGRTARAHRPANSCRFSGKKCESLKFEMRSSTGSRVSKIFEPVDLFNRLVQRRVKPRAPCRATCRSCQNHHRRKSCVGLASR
jgi:hypothetical protein